MRHIIFVFLLFFSVSASAKPKPVTWESTIATAVPAIVAIRVVGTRNFDTESARASVGTGFVVDKERGLILTNRHMVHAGPVVAEAVFNNHEEVPLQAVYRDPVHDFGFYRFDPSAVKFLELAELPLRPDGAKVGLDIRVIGNDSGEKISILDGTIARLDRAAPRYGGNTYNDFNTFYLQAASNTSGGSSGSPVINRQGEVVGLNAGGRKIAASSFYLPLARVSRALKLIQAGDAVPRGTLQTVFQHKPFDELRRLGLGASEETKMRSTEGAVGGLVVAETVPKGPAWALLQSGDILLEVNSQRIQSFEPLAAILDESVGEKVKCRLHRGAEVLNVELTVRDLHAITPDEYVEFGQGIVHTLSYQQARNHSVPVSGVYVASTGFAFRRSGVPKGAVLTSVNGSETVNSESFFDAVKGLGHGQRVPIKYHAISDPNHPRVGSLVIDRQWNSLKMCKRRDDLGTWPCSTASVPDRAPPVGPQTALPAEGISGPAKHIADSLVIVEFHVPVPTAGLKGFIFEGTGLIVDAEKGLVLVDRDTIPVKLGEVSITFGGQVRVDGEVHYVHPVHNFALVRYDPATLGDTRVRSIRFSRKTAEGGMDIWQVGMNSSHQIVQFKAQVARSKPIYLAKSNTPKYRDMNIEGIDLVDHLSSLGGVLVDRRGRVLALWASFYDPKDDERDFFGLPNLFFQPTIEAFRNGMPPSYSSIGAEVWPVSLADARELGLPEAWAKRLFQQDPRRRKVLRVLEVWGGSPAKKVLAEGDLIVALNGEVVTRMGDVEAVAGEDEIAVTRIREGKEETVTLPMTPLDGNSVVDLISWAGLVVHAPHHEVAAQTGRESGGVYTAWVWYGSPASRYRIYATRRILEIDGVAIPDMDTFYEVVQKQKNGQSVRVKLENLDQKVRVKTLKIDLDYWKPERLQWRNGRWNRLDSTNE